MRVLTQDYSPITGGFASITVDATAGGTAITLPTGVLLNTVSMVLITCESFPCRYTLDTVAPTALIGHLFTPGMYLMLANRQSINNFRAFRTTGDSAVLKVTFFGGGR